MLDQFKGPQNQANKYSDAHFGGNCFKQVVSSQTKVDCLLVRKWRV